MFILKYYHKTVNMIVAHINIHLENRGEIKVEKKEAIKLNYNSPS